MGPLLALLADRGDLSGGIAALAMFDDGEVRVAAVADPVDAASPASASSSASDSWERSSPRPAPPSRATASRFPSSSAERLSAPSPSRASSCPATALSLASSVASLVAEALGLRRRLARAAALGAENEGLIGPGHAVPQSAEPLFVDEGWAPAAIVGRSAPMRELFSMMDRVAGTETTVLITGESGTGKELVARALHERSGRAKKAFVAVNCAAFARVGHRERALRPRARSLHRRPGAAARPLRARRRRNLFLDEIGELSPPSRPSSSALQEGEFQRVGGSATLKTDVRVLAATNRDLEKEVADSRFRSDLFWRLNVFPLRVPPLRERRSDIVLLADHFAEKHGRRSGKPILRISSPAIDLLVTYHWPGNVRELENCIERAVILSTDSVIHAYHLPPSLQSADSTGTGPASTLDASLARLERELLVEALKICRGNAAAAARRLGVTERRMGLALHRYGIDWRRFRTSM
jgi:Nif-specific regulatory protein